MMHSHWTLAAISVLGFATPALAQGIDFNLTYHVERTPAAQLSIEACGQAVVNAATQAGLRSATQSYPDQLVPTDGSMPASASRSLSRMLRYCAPRPP